MITQSHLCACQRSDYLVRFSALSFSLSRSSELKRGKWLENGGRGWQVTLLLLGSAVLSRDQQILELVCADPYYYQEPTETIKQPIRTRYSGHVTGYQPIENQYFLIRSVPRFLYSLSSREEHTTQIEEQIIAAAAIYGLKPLYLGHLQICQVMTTAHAPAPHTCERGLEHNNCRYDSVGTRFLISSLAANLTFSLTHTRPTVQQAKKKVKHIPSITTITTVCPQFSCSCIFISTSSLTITPASETIALFPINTSYVSDVLRSEGSRGGAVTGVYDVYERIGEYWSLIG
eukprot:sb/3467675/